MGKNAPFAGIQSKRKILQKLRLAGDEGVTRLCPGLQGRHCAPSFAFGHPPAGPVRVSEFVIRGHERPRSPSHDHFDQLIAVQEALPQVRGATVGCGSPAPSVAQP
jgi:hypothetical protein